VSPALRGRVQAVSPCSSRGGRNTTATTGRDLPADIRPPQAGLHEESRPRAVWRPTALRIWWEHRWGHLLYQKIIRLNGLVPTSQPSAGPFIDRRRPQAKLPEGSLWGSAWPISTNTEQAGNDVEKCPTCYIRTAGGGCPCWLRSPPPTGQKNPDLGRHRSPRARDRGAGVGHRESDTHTNSRWRLVSDPIAAGPPFSQRLPNTWSNKAT